MKLKDIVPLIIVIIISSIAAFIASSIFVPDPPTTREIDVMDKIDSTFPQPEVIEKILGSKTIDTSVPIGIGNENIPDE